MITHRPRTPAVTVPFTPGRARVGSYLDLKGLSLRQSLDLRRRQLGRDQDIVHVFYPWRGDMPRSQPDVARSSTLMVSWHAETYAEVNNGSSDRMIAAADRVAGRFGVRGRGDAEDGRRGGRRSA